MKRTPVESDARGLAMRFVILEDNPDRRGQFTGVLLDRFPNIDLVFAETSGDCIRLIDEAWDRVAFVALDNDLDLLTTSYGATIDAGSGLDVAGYLSRRQPAFPVLIHTTNAAAGDAIQSQLEQAGWPVDRVVPYGDLEWIAERWYPAARSLVVRHAPRQEPAAVSELA